MITENAILTPAQQKQLVIKEVVKKHLKEAGFKSVGQTFYSVRNDICLAVNIYSSQFNSFYTGYTFTLRINAFPADTEKNKLKIINEDIRDCIDNDFRQYIMPGLQKIQCRDDYNKCKEEIWRYSNSTEVCILRFLTSIHMSGNIRPKYDIEDFFDRWHITAEDVRANFSMHTFDEGDMTETFAVPAVGAIIVKKVEGETDYECSEI